MIYKDFRGLIIADDIIVDLIRRSGKTEEQWNSFVGKELWETDGFAAAFLDSFVKIKAWAINIQEEKTK